MGTHNEDEDKEGKDKEDNDKEDEDKENKDKEDKNKDKKSNLVEVSVHNKGAYEDEDKDGRETHF